MEQIIKTANGYNIVKEQGSSIITRDFCVSDLIKVLISKGLLKEEDIK